MTKTEIGTIITVLITFVGGALWIGQLDGRVKAIENIGLLSDFKKNGVDAINEIKKEKDNAIIEIKKNANIEKQKFDLANKSIPIGTIVAIYSDIIPDGWLLCDGKPIPIQNKELIKIIGNNTPNLRDMFLRGKTIEREIGNYQKDQLQQHQHKIWKAVAYQHYDANVGPVIVPTNINQGDINTGNIGSDANVGDETRPKNIAVNYIIKR